MKSINAKGIISDLQNKIKKDVEARIKAGIKSKILELKDFEVVYDMSNEKATIVGLDEEQMELLSKNGF